MQADTAGAILTICVFVGVGVFLGQAFSLPVKVHIWVLLVFAAVGGAFVGIHTSLLSLFGAEIRLNAAIVCCVAGVLIALVVRTLRQRRSSTAPA